MTNYRLDFTTSDSEELALTAIVSRVNAQIVREWESENLRRAAQDPPLPPLPTPAPFINAGYLVFVLMNTVKSYVGSLGAEDFSTLRDSYIAADDATRDTVKDTLRTGGVRATLSR